MNSAGFLKHLIGLLVFSIILFFTVLIDNVEKFPSIASKLPYRFFVVAKQPVKLYQCENFEQQTQIGVLETGETADFESVACGMGTRWRVRLSNGSHACFSGRDEDKVEQKHYRFYYF